LSECQRLRPSFRDNKNILSRGETRPLRAEEFAEEPFHPVPHYRVAKAARDRNAKTRVFSFRRREHNNEMGTIATFPMVLEKEEFSAR